ncbi:MAG: FliH/SctL family protein, partial [Rhodanobacteraceae bacterium]
PDPGAIERIEAEARQRGHAEGLQRGSTEIATRVAALDALIASLAAPLARQEQTIADAIRQTAWTLGELLAREQLRRDPQNVSHIVREAVTALAAPDQPLTIRVSTRQYDAIRAALEQHPPAQTWHLDADPVLADGDCIVTTSHATANAAFETRLRLLGEQLLETPADHDDDTGSD